MKLMKTVALGLLLLVSIDGLSQCGCTFTIPNSTSTINWDGVANGVKPGDVICLSAGFTKRIYFTNVRGSATNYVTIKNCGGQAIVGDAAANSAILLQNCQFFRLTGTGDAGYQRGIKIPETKPSGAQGVTIFDLSTDFEVDHLEVSFTGFAGIMAKSDPSDDCSNYSYERPNFTMKNVNIHDNYIHDTPGEGIYLGNSFYLGTLIYCGSRTQYSHEVRHVNVHNNLIENSGWESIQVGSAVEDLEIHDNRIYNYGTKNKNSQNGGIQVGEGSIGKVYNNFIKGGTGKAIFVQGLGKTDVFNNLIINPGTASIQMALLGSALPTDIVPPGSFLGPIRVMNNTIINPSTSETVKESLAGAPGNLIYNNLVVGGPSNWLRLRGDTDWKNTNNLYIPLIADAKFVNPSLDDYRLLSGSPAVNTGRDVSAFGVTFDLDNAGRPAGAAWDLGAYELSGNQKPVVNVGANQSLTLPTNSTTITGSATDADGTIASYLWTKQSGPTATLSNQATTTVTLTNLLEGVYIFRLTATDNQTETGFKEVTVTVVDPSVNQLPVANAGGNKSLTLPTNSTNLNGSASDPDGTISSYAWTKVSGPAATLTNAGSATLTLTGLVQGIYVFRLTVTDDDSAIDTEDAQVTVNPAAANQLPTANAGIDKPLQLPTNSTSLTGSGSDPDGSISTYLWTKKSGPAATLTNAGTPTLQLTNLVVGTYVFRLTVTDNATGTAFDEATVTVTAANQAPTASAGVNKAIQLPTNSTTLPGSGSDPDGSISSYLWTKISGPAATLTNAGTPVLSLTSLVQGTYVFRLTVTDNNLATGSDDITLTVQLANVPPVANAGLPKTITLPVNSTTLNGTGTDADGSIASYLWEKVSGPSVSISGSTTASLSLTNLVVGAYVFRLTVTDNNGAPGTSLANVTVLPVATNQAPVADAGSNLTLTLPANAIDILGSATDADGTISSYLWTKVSGPAATLSGTTLATLSLTNLVAGTYVFRLTATDNLNSTASDDVSLVVSNVNQSPTVIASNDEILTLPNSSTTLSAVASDPDGTIASYLWINLSGPAAPTLGGATTNTLSVSGLIAGTYVFRVTATDNNSATATDQVNVVVQTSTNINPIANAGSDISIFLPTNTVILPGSGTDADGTISGYTWTQVAGAAAILTNANTATLTTSALVAGPYTFRLTVTDNAGGTGIKDVNVTVNLASSNQIPTANAGPDIALTLPNNSTNLIGSASDPDGSIASYTWIKLSGPSVTLSNENTSVLSLQDLVTGVYVFRLTVTDNVGAFASDNIQVIIFPASVNQSPSVTAGTNITLILPTNSTNLVSTASDPDGTIASYTWTKQIGPPATLTGSNSSTLTLSDLVVGSYTFRINVIDNGSSSAFDEVIVTVLALGSNNPPTVNAGIDKILFLPTNSINLLGSASDTDGSIASYTWAKMKGPTATLANQNTPNLSLSNLVAGQYTFRLSVTDNQNEMGFDEADITIFPGTVNQAPIANAGSNQTIVSPISTTTLSGSGFDTDGSIASYSWTQILGPSTTLTNINSPSLLIENLTEGIFQFQLTVTDDQGATGSGVAQIVVVPIGSQQPPIANAGFDKVLNLPQDAIDIQGSGSDPDGTIASYAWLKKSGPASGTLSGQATSKLSVTGLAAGIYVFSLTVTDNEGLPNTDEVRVTVLQPSVNNNPTVSAGVDQFIRLPTNSATLTATASDIDGSIASYLWTQVSGPLATLTGASTSTLSLSNLLLGVYTFRIEVTDNNSATASDDVMVTVSPAGANSKPTVLAGAPKIVSFPVTSTSLNGSASDSDGSIKLVLWTQQNGPNTATLAGSNTTTLSVQGLVQGSYTFRLTGEDNEGASAFSETTVEVRSTQPAPVVYAGNDTTLFLPNNFMPLVGDVQSGSSSISELIWTQVDGTIPAKILGEYPDASIINLLPSLYTFRLTAIDDGGIEFFDDIVVTVNEGDSNPLGAALYFSPNGDGVNDLWTIKNLNMVDGCPVTIFNNLGSKLYEANQFNNDWNVLTSSSTLSLREADYYFIFKCPNKKTYSGAFRLIR